jgi:hypothetical protein
VIRFRLEHSPNCESKNCPSVWQAVVARAVFAMAIAAVLFFGLALSASAHVKWFHEDDEYPLRTDLIISWNTGLLIGVAGLALAGLYLLQRSLGDRYWPHIRFLDKMAIGAPTLLAVQAAITLIHAAVQPSLFAPNMAFGVTLLGLSFALIQILIALMKRPGKVCTRAELMKEAWGEGVIVDPRNVDVHVRLIRAQLEGEPDGSWLIQTVHGVGYRFAGELGPNISAEGFETEGKTV